MKKSQLKEIIRECIYEMKIPSPEIPMPSDFTPENPMAKSWKLSSSSRIRRNQRAASRRARNPAWNDTEKYGSLDAKQRRNGL